MRLFARRAVPFAVAAKKTDCADWDDFKEISCPDALATVDESFERICALNLGNPSDCTVHVIRHSSNYLLSVSEG